MSDSKYGSEGGQLTASPHRSGVVAMVGPPNAGKSTLLNLFLGQKIAIVTPRPQTTRNRIMGIITGDDHQIILLDTPGLHKPKELLNREMVRIAMESLADADVVLFLVDCAARGDKEKMQRRRAEFRGYLKNIKCPVVLALNKIDLLPKERLLPVIDWYSDLHPFAAMVPISALEGQGTDELLREIVQRLPEGPQYYPEDIPTDATERFIVAEMIREKIFLLTRDEVPYSTAVLIESFKESLDNKPVVIHALILVERDSQKAIIIGKGGKMLKEIGKSARLEIEHMLDCRVVLKLWVEVKKKWTKSEQVLRELGM